MIPATTRLEKQTVISIYEEVRSNKVSSIT